MLKTESVGFQRLLGTSDVARLFGCSEAQVREYVREGRLAAITIGRSHRYTTAALEAFIVSAEVVPK
jgi:excisionase family DNA binding protein